MFELLAFFRPCIDLHWWNVSLLFYPTYAFDEELVLLLGCRIMRCIPLMISHSMNWWTLDLVLALIFFRHWYPFKLHSCRIPRDNKWVPGWCLDNFHTWEVSLVFYDEFIGFQNIKSWLQRLIFVNLTDWCAVLKRGEKLWHDAAMIWVESVQNLRG